MRKLAMSTISLLAVLGGCAFSKAATEIVAHSTSQPRPLSNLQAATISSCSAGKKPLWSDSFNQQDWKAKWQLRKPQAWGLDNSQVVTDSSRQFSKALKVSYVSGSASPLSLKEYGSPLGGTQFFATLGLPPQDSRCLSYYLRFSKDFNFVKGGKLPGLFGGTVNDGRKIPDGTNGFSTRFMWRRHGDGEVYAYLPTSKDHGTSLGRGQWRFKPGVWHHLEQNIVLNKPGKQDGRVSVWLDGKPVLNVSGLTFRTTTDLQIEGILFSTFFGGGDPSWATPKSVYTEFANFSVY